MAGIILRIKLETHGQGLFEITQQVKAQLNAAISAGGEPSGLCNLFVRHTSCSLLIQENADPSARLDLQNWLNRLVPENDRLYTHTFEGADDMPAHIKSMLTATQLAVPYENGKLLLGTWQGIFLWEHRHASQRRELILHLH